MGSQTWRTCSEISADWSTINALIQVITLSSTRDFVCNVNIRIIQIIPVSCVVCFIFFAEIFPFSEIGFRSEAFSAIFACTVNSTFDVNHLWPVWNRHSWCKYWLFDCRYDCLYVSCTFNRRYTLQKLRISKQCDRVAVAPLSLFSSSRARVLLAISSFRVQFQLLHLSFSEKANLLIYFTSVWRKNTLPTLSDSSASLNLSFAVTASTFCFDSSIATTRFQGSQRGLLPRLPSSIVTTRDFKKRWSQFKHLRMWLCMLILFDIYLHFQSLFILCIFDLLSLSLCTFVLTLFYWNFTVN